MTETQTLLAPNGTDPRTVDVAETPPVQDLPERSAIVPQPPESLAEAGLSEDFVDALAVKTLYLRGAVLALDLADMLALPVPIVDEALERLQENRYVEVHETRGPRRGDYVFKLTGSGRKKATEELEVSRYVGPAPVPFEAFQKWVELQSAGRAGVTESQLRAVLDDLVVPDEMLNLLGPAINSGSSLFLWGGPGDGKTLLAERVGEVFGDRYFVPHAVLVDGSVMIVYDPILHRTVGKCREDGDLDEATDADAGILSEIVRAAPDHDPRWVEAQRPVVVTGGELTLEQLDLQWDPAGRMYQAPPQLKAAGGVLLVDDLGRQRVPVRDLLNRWIVPLEQRRDYLTVRSGRKIIVPFDCLVIFSTNLEPSELTDEAFLRRIHYKIEITSPDRSEYEGIFRACCVERGIEFDADALDLIYGAFYGVDGHTPRRCHPRDVLNHLTDLAEYLAQPPSLSPELLEQACRSYFLPTGRGVRDGRSERP